MVCSNYQIFWLTALLLFGAVLPLVHGWYPTCPTTRGETLLKKTDLQNPASYTEKKCYGACCAHRGLSWFSVAINIWCSDSCGSPQVDCSIASNRCRNVADITGYYKSSAFISCPYDSEIKWGKTPGTVDTTEMLCPATDTCGVAIFGYATVLQDYQYSPVFGCMDSCKQRRTQWAKTRIPKGKTISSDCTECSSTDDCKKKLASGISHRSCPTTKGRELSTKRAIENVKSYEEKICTGQDKCCAQKRRVGQLKVEVKCGPYCGYWDVDCSQYGSHCRNVADMMRNFHLKSDYVPCMHVINLHTVSSNERAPKQENFEIVFCPKTENCYAGRVKFPFMGSGDHNTLIQVYAGCMRECDEFLGEPGAMEVYACRACYTIDDCQKILQEP